MLPAAHCNCTVHNRPIHREHILCPISRSFQVRGRAAAAADMQSTAADGRNLVSPQQAELHSSSSNARPRKYLTFDEYVALQQQHKEQQAAIQQQQQALGAGTSNVGSIAATSQPSEERNDAEEGPKKRVPWNKGRKHSALTIARIVSGNARARERPEVKAKVDAWNKSRVGSSLPDEVREKIRQGGLEARMRRLQNTTPEELEARRADISERSKKLWQDPEYVAKTKGALRAAMERRRSKTSPSSSSSSSSDNSSSSVINEDTAPTRPRASRCRAAAARSAVDEAHDEQQQQQQEDHQQQPQQQRQLQEPKAPRQARPKQPTKKELAAAAAAAAAAQRQQLQGQVDRLLQMQQLIATSERTVQDLQCNLQAFENNPQAYQIASNTMQQAQVHLGTLRAQVHSLRNALQQQGVVWDSNTGLITHVAGLVDAITTSSNGGGGGRKGSSSSSNSKVGARKGASSSSSKSKNNGSSSSSVPDDVVRSSRRDKRDAGSFSPTQPTQSSGVVRSARRQAAAAAAASSGGSRRDISSSSRGGASWEVTPAKQAVNGVNGLNGSVKVRASVLNGKHHMNGFSGHGSSSSSSSAADGSTYVAVKVEQDVLLGGDTL